MTELETVQRAKMYMDKLAQGIDPISGQALPEDSALNNIRLARCFFYVSGILDQVIQNGGQVTAAQKANFSITPEQLSSVEICPYPIRITEFTDALYAAVNTNTVKKLQPSKITDWLLQQGLLTKETGPDGKMRRVPTEAGFGIGLTTQMRQSPNGEYLAVYYNPDAQRFLLEHIYTILEVS